MAEHLHTANDVGSELLLVWPVASCGATWKLGSSASLAICNEVNFGLDWSGIEQRASRFKPGGATIRYKPLENYVLIRCARPRYFLCHIFFADTSALLRLQHPKKYGFLTVRVHQHSWVCSIAPFWSATPPSCPIALSLPNNTNEHASCMTPDICHSLKATALGLLTQTTRAVCPFLGR